MREYEKIELLYVLVSLFLFFLKNSMNISTQNFTLARKSSGGVYREFRHFSPNGFDENVWILFEGDEVGEELFDEICEKTFSHIFENEEGKSLSPVERFENSMKELNDKVSDEAVLPENFLTNNSFIILLSFENQLHFTTIGGSEIYFLRGGKVLHISEGIAAENIEDDLFLNIASGEIQDGDILVSSTIRLLRYVSNTQLKEITAHSAEESVKTIEDFIGKEEGGVFGVIKAQGAPALPFDQVGAPLRREVYQQGGKNGLSFHDIALPPFLLNCKKYIPASVKNEYLFLGIAVVFLMIIWSFISLLSGGISNDTAHFKEMIHEINSDIGIAENKIRDGRKAEALLILDSAEIQAKEVFNNPQSTFRTQANRHLKKIEEMRDYISDTTRMSGNALVNISVKKESVDLQGVLAFDEEFYAYDNESLFKIIGKTVETVIPLKSDERVIKAIPLEKKKEIIFLTESGKILEGKGASITYAKTEDSGSWKKAVDIGFFDKNIYLLSPENNEVYKYVKKADIFSAPVSYNKNADITDGISLTIDGSIYVLKPNGKVIKMLRGTTEDFDLVDAPDGFEGVDVIYTLRDLSLMLFLDKEEKRVYVFRKGEEGATFDKQIIIDTSEEDSLSGLWFDINANRILVSGKKRVYEVALTQ